MTSDNLKYISIDSIIYDIGTIMDDDSINEDLIREWATKGYRRIQLAHKYEDAVALIQVIDHKAMLPSNAHHIIQVLSNTGSSEVVNSELEKITNIPGDSEYLDSSQLPENIITALGEMQTPWRPMRLATNTFHELVNTEYNLFPDSVDYTINKHEYSVDKYGCILSTLQNGWILVAYRRYKTDANGSPLIPDEENLKDALMHFCLYRYWLSRSSRKQQGAIQEREFNRDQYLKLSAKASAILQDPSVDRMENIKNMLNKLIPRTNRHETMFTDLAYKEKEYYNVPNSFRRHGR